MHAAFLDLTKAFGKCLFSNLFRKLIEKGIPAIIVRVLSFAYQEQKAWVKLGRDSSATFNISNGTRQGSVLSPYFFGVYLDNLLIKLRQLQLGCYVAGVWMGACAFADDIALLAPGRQVLQKMITECERYGLQNNLVFSTDPVPSKSKTKCILFSGKKKVKEPQPIYLDGKALPWVDSVQHLGHILHETMSMNCDVNRARNSFMSRANDIRDKLYFCNPSQRMSAIQLYCCDAYGSMLWDLSSSKVDSFFKAWNIQARLAWNIPRETFTYLIEGYFCKDMVTLRNQILSRYPGFVRKLLASPSKEIRFLANNVLHDQRSITAKNLLYIESIANCAIMNYASWKVRQNLPVKSVHSSDSWRTSLLNLLLEARHVKNYSIWNLSKTQLEDMIKSLCMS